MTRGLWTRETVALFLLAAYMPLALFWLLSGGVAALGQLGLCILVVGFWHLVFMLVRHVHCCRRWRHASRRGQEQAKFAQNCTAVSRERHKQLRYTKKKCVHINLQPESSYGDPFYEKSIIFFCTFWLGLFFSRRQMK